MGSEGPSLVSVVAVGRGEDVRASMEEGSTSDMRFGGMWGVVVGIGLDGGNQDDGLCGARRRRASALGVDLESDVVNVGVVVQSREDEVDATKTRIRS